MNAVEAAKAYVSTYFENDPITRGVANAKRDLTDLGESMQSIGRKAIALSAPLLGIAGYATTAFAGTAGELVDLNQITGIGIESLSEMSYAATRLGSSMDSLKGALGKQTKFLGDVQSGSKEAVATLDRLGISMDSLEGLSPDKTFGVFADAIAGISDHTEKANAAMDIFGKSGADLLPFLNAGSMGIDEMRREARDLGVVMSDETARAGDELSDTLDKLKSQLKAAADSLAGVLTPAMTDLLERVTPVLANLIEWISTNDQLIMSVITTVAQVAAGGVAFAVAGYSVGKLGETMGVLSSVLGSIKNVIGTVTGAYWGLSGVIAKVGGGAAKVLWLFLTLLEPTMTVASGGTILMAVGGGLVSVFGTLAGAFSLLLSPTMLVAAALAYLAYEFIDFGAIASWVADQATAAWEYLSSSLGESLALASQLVMNGELSLAMELLWAQIQVVWAEGVQATVQATGSMVTQVVGVLAKALDQLGTLIDKTRNKLAKGVAAAGEFTGLFPEGTSEELNAMQGAGQVGETALHDLAKSLETAAEGFQDLGGNVDELKKKLAGIKDASIQANIKADVDRAKKQQDQKPPPKKDDRPRPILAGAGSALSGTFSSVASRQLFSGGGNVVETELKTISRNTAETAKQVAKKAKVGS